MSRKQTTTKPAGKAHSAAQRVYQSLKESVLSLELPPNADIDEAKLVAQFKVSRTPVREALIRLSSEGLIVLSPNRSGRVASISLKDVLDHQEAIELFEPAVCYLAAARRTPDDLTAMKQALANYRAAVKKRVVQAMIQQNYEFHRTIGVASHNESIKRAYYQIIIDKLRIAQYGTFQGTESESRSLQPSFSSAIKIYERLAAAIEARDCAAAWQCGKDHSTHVRQQLSKVVAERMPSNLVPQPRA